MAQVKVQTGDTVSDIAKRFNVPNAAVSGFRSRNPNTIFPEEVLEVDETQRIQTGTQPIAAGVAQDTQAGTQGDALIPSSSGQELASPLQAPEEQPEAGLQLGTGESVEVDEQGEPTAEIQGTGGEEQFFGQFGIAPEAIEQGFQTNPFGTLSDIVGQVMEATGLPSFRADITSTANQIEEIENERDRQIEVIQDNPFVSAGSKQQRIEKLRDKFDKRINARVNKLTLLQGQQNAARQQAQFAATTAINLFGKQQQFQQDQIDRVLDERERVLEAQREDEDREFERRLDEANLSLAERRVALSEREAQRRAETTTVPRSTQSQFQAATFSQRIIDSEDVLSGGRGRFVPFAPERLKSEERKKFEQAEANFITAVLRRESGAAIADSEFDSARRVYIPRPGDDESVLQRKARARAVVLQGLQNEAGGAGTQLTEGLRTTRTGTTKGGLKYTIEE